VPGAKSIGVSDDKQLISVSLSAMSHSTVQSKLLSSNNARQFHHFI
jgi:hypothetical protein